MKYTQPISQTIEQMVLAYERQDLNDGAFPRFCQDPFCLKDFSRPRLRKFLPRLVYALLFFIACLFWDTVWQAWLQASMTGFYESEWGVSHEDFASSQEWLKANMPQTYAARWGSTPPNETSPLFAAKIRQLYQNQTLMLYDVGFLGLPSVSTGAYADAWVAASIAGAMLRFVILPGPMSLRWIFLSRAFTVWGILFLLRGFVIVITPLPNPYRQCEPQTAFPHNVFLQAIAFFVPRWGAQNTCQDVLFSGHTVAGTMWTLFFVKYVQKAPWFQISLEWTLPHKVFHGLGVLWLICGWYVIIASQFHYSVDVFIGALLTFTVYGFYHNFIFVIWLKVRPIETWFHVALRWLEDESFDVQQWKMFIECNVERQYIYQRESRRRDVVSRSVTAPSLGQSLSDSV